MKLLHIGGPLDGFRKNAPDTHCFQVAIFSPGLGDCMGDPLVSIPIQTSSYVRRRCCRINGTFLDVAVSLDKANSDVLDLLVKGYRGHRNPKRKFPKFPI